MEQEVAACSWCPAQWRNCQQSCVMVPKEPLPRRQSGEGATTCSGVSWLCTMVQVSSAFSPALETVPSCRSATYTWKGRSPPVPCLSSTWNYPPQLRLAAPGSLQAEKEMFMGQAPVGSQGRMAGQEQVSEDQLIQEAASWILMGMGTWWQNYCIGINLTCCINGCPYSIKEIVPSS